MSTVMLDTANDRLCQTCGYNLRGLEGNRCPECGGFFDPKRLAEARIPWLRRLAIGKWRAYWQTVAMVMFHPVKFGREVWDAPRLEPRGAIQFRRIIVWQAVISADVLVAMLAWVKWGRLFSHIFDLFIVQVMTTIAVFVFLIMATEVTDFGLTTTSDDGRGWRRAMRCYASAPLAMSPLVLLTMSVTFWFDEPLSDAGTLLLVAMIAWWWLANVLIDYAAHESVAMVIWKVVTLPFIWGSLALAATLLTLGLVSALLVVRFWF